ncbi:MAG: hypothetical protein L3J43_05685 [Sulfurovum sp.]|nr:hypothetical protein [Sulfurovum sp.]
MPFSTLYAITADELLEVHKVTTTEMNSITTPQAGSLVFNTTENTLYFYTGSAWKRLRSTGSETKVNAGSGMVVTGNGTSSVPYTIGTN